MKGKKLLTLLSVFAGAAVVGTTFAAWAVTDNADPFGIKVTPGSSIVDDTKFVTLSYGSQYMAENVTGLTAEKPKVAAKVGLLADTAGDAYTGKFTMELEELEEKETGAKLIDNLTVSLYNEDTHGEIAYNASKEVTTDISEMTPDAVVPTSESELVASKTYTVADNTQKIVYVIVSLKSGLSPAVLDQIHNDKVRITMDWGKGSDDDVEATDVFFNAGAEGTYYAYAWTDAGAKNAEWPGVAMVQDSESDKGVYKVSLGCQYTKVIFNNNNDYQTDDLDLDDDIRTDTPCYSKADKEWGVKPGKSAMTKDYYVIGSFNSWTLTDDTWAMTQVGETTQYTYSNLALTANATLKVRAKVTSGTEGWFSSVDYFGEGIKAHVDGEGNIVVEEAGTYNVSFYTDGQNGNYVQLAKVTA